LQITVIASNPGYLNNLTYKFRKIQVLLSQENDRFLDSEGDINLI